MRQASESSGGRVTVVTLIAVVLLLLVYPLSMGPAFWLCSDPLNRFGSEAGVKGQVFLTVYTPLLICYQRGPAPLRKLIGGYLRFYEK